MKTKIKNLVASFTKDALKTLMMFFIGGSIVAGVFASGALSNLRVSPGDTLTAEKWNTLIDTVENLQQGGGSGGGASGGQISDALAFMFARTNYPTAFPAQFHSNFCAFFPNAIFLPLKGDLGICISESSNAMYDEYVKLVQGISPLTEYHTNFCALLPGTKFTEVEGGKGICMLSSDSITLNNSLTRYFLLIDKNVKQQVGRVVGNCREGFSAYAYGGKCVQNKQVHTRLRLEQAKYHCTGYGDGGRIVTQEEYSKACSLGVLNDTGTGTWEMSDNISYGEVYIGQGSCSASYTFNSTPSGYNGPFRCVY
jgi:hypothetical protein